MSLPVSWHMTAKAVVNMAAGKRRLANRCGLAYALLNSAAALIAASRGVTLDLERVCIDTGSCCERVLRATGSLGSVGGGSTGRQGVFVGASVCSTLGQALSLGDLGVPMLVAYSSRSIARVRR